MKRIILVLPPLSCYAANCEKATPEGDALAYG
jgi:hypothetical protein